MADLATLQSGVSAPAYQTHALNLGQDAPAALPPNTAKLSAAQGHAALMGTVAKTLSELPGVIAGDYLQGKKITQQAQGQSRLQDVLAGRATLPPGTSLSSDGSITYKGPGALSPLEQQEKEADVKLKQAHAKYYSDKVNGTGANGTESNPMYDVLGLKSSTPSVSGGALSSEGLASGPAGDYHPLDKPVEATSYAYHGDTFGGPRALASTTGPKGNKLDSSSLATSPDHDALLTKLGYKFGDNVTLHTDSGAAVTGRWDDKTAQWDSTGKWSVTDGGKYISKLDGKAYAELPESQRLPALHGRFDFHAGADGKPSKYAGLKIIGVAPKTNSVEPPLPTGGALSALPAQAPVVRRGVPVTDTLDSTGMPPVATDAPSATPPVTPALANAGGEEESELSKLQKQIAIVDKSDPSPERERQLNELNAQYNAALAKETDTQNGMEMGPDGMPTELPGFYPEASQEGAGTPDLPPVPSQTAAGGTPTAPASNAPLVLPDGELNPAAVESAAQNPYGGTPIPGKVGIHKGPLYMHNGMAIEVAPDGGVYGYPEKSKKGTSGIITLKKPDPAAKYGPDAKKMMMAYGVKPLDGESEQDFMIRAAQAGREASKVPPSVQAGYMKWATSLSSNPVIKNYITAREQQHTVEAALSTGLTPATALATIDSFTRAMSGGRATQGMTHILSEAQPLRSQLENLYNRVTGTPEENAILTPAMAGQIKSIISKVAAKAKEEAEGMMEGDKEHWDTFNVPPLAVEKTYKRIFGGKPSSLDMMGLDPTAEAAPAGAPGAAAPGAAAVPPTLTAPKPVNSQAEYDALPPGTPYTDSKGTLAVKGGAKK